MWIRASSGAGQTEGGVDFGGGFQKLQEEESGLQEKKNHANTEAEIARTSLEEYEGQLRITIRDCMGNPLLGCMEVPLPDMDREEASFEELIEAVKEAKTRVEAMAKENQKNVFPWIRIAGH